VKPPEPKISSTRATRERREGFDFIAPLTVVSGVDSIAGEREVIGDELFSESGRSRH
jgi:hypothetical protein